MSDRIHIDFAAMPFNDLTQGARDKVIDRDGKRFRLLELSPKFVEDGWCVREHAGYVIEGELEIDTKSGSTLKFIAGDGLNLSGGDNYAHKARALTPRVLLFLTESA